MLFLQNADGSYKELLDDLTALLINSKLGIIEDEITAGSLDEEKETVLLRNCCVNLRSMITTPFSKKVKNFESKAVKRANNGEKRRPPNSRRNDGRDFMNPVYVLDESLNQQSLVQFMFKWVDQ